jgi:hypothetical protein
MAQNKDTGAAGNDFGRDNAPRIAEAIGANLTRPGSNEATWNGVRAVIKSAGKRTPSVGVTYSMLDTLQIIIAAFEQKPGVFEVYTLPADRFAYFAVDSRTNEKVGLVTRKVFSEKGQLIKIVQVS